MWYKYFSLTSEQALWARLGVNHHYATVSMGKCILNPIHQFARRFLLEYHLFPMKIWILLPTETTKYTFYNPKFVVSFKKSLLLDVYFSSYYIYKLAVSIRKKMRSVCLLFIFTSKNIIEGLRNMQGSIVILEVFSCFLQKLVVQGL